MSKVMIFIDGTWLYANTAKLAADYGRPDLQIDYGLLPEAVTSRVQQLLGVNSADIVRTNLFASSPINHDPKDRELVQRRNDFFSMLKEEYHYEVDVYPIDFRGRRIRSIDRDPLDKFEPREKCVDIALATSLLYYAAIPGAYDIAIVIVGDRDYIPVLQHVRKLAKRLSIVSIRGSCAQEYADPVDHARVKDTDIIWLNDMIGEVELKYERRQLVCQSEFHSGDRKVWTTYRPRKGQPFFCDTCRQMYTSRNMNQNDYEPAEIHHAEVSTASTARLSGYIYDIKDDRRYGFIRASNSDEYFFHLADLDNCTWSDISVGAEISFEEQNPPSQERAGHAKMVQIEETTSSPTYDPDVEEEIELDEFDTV